MHWLNIAKIITATQAEGPGLRFVIWVQGCLKRCKGCCNEKLLQIEPTNVIKSGKIIAQLQQAVEQHALEGITLLDGEPMLQAEGLADIAEATRIVSTSFFRLST